MAALQLECLSESHYLLPVTLSKCRNPSPCDHISSMYPVLLTSIIVRCGSACEQKPNKTFVEQNLVLIDKKNKIHVFK